jgi:hypothetical protein
MKDTVELSVVPAVTLTGEVTLSLLAGLQIVTEGEAVLSVHGAEELLVR